MIKWDLVIVVDCLIKASHTLGRTLVDEWRTHSTMRCLEFTNRTSKQSQKHLVSGLLRWSDSILSYSYKTSRHYSRQPKTFTFICTYMYTQTFISLYILNMLHMYIHEHIFFYISLYVFTLIHRHMYIHTYVTYTVYKTYKSFLITLRS